MERAVEFIAGSLVMLGVVICAVHALLGFWLLA